MINKLRHWLERFQLSETIILWGLALLVGLTTGIGVWLFKLLIDLIHQVEQTNLETWLTSMVIKIVTAPRITSAP